MGEESSVFGANDRLRPVTTKRTNLWMLLVMLLIGISSLCWSERLPVGDGLGWDGRVYATWAADFYKSVFVDRVADYYVQRVLPSAIVHYGARAALAPFASQSRIHELLAQPKNIITAFGIYNLALLLLAVFVWGIIADQLKITDRGKWLGFCFLFLNYAVLKHNFYSPVSLDISAFTLGVLMFYFFLGSNSLGLLTVMIMGGFTWPTLPFMAFLLLVFRRPEVISVRPSAPSAFVRRLSLVVASMVLLGVFLLLVYLIRGGVVIRWDRAQWTRVNFAVLYLSVVAVLVYFFLGFRAAFLDGQLFDLGRVWKAVEWRWALAGAFVLFLLRVVVYNLQGPIPSSWNLQGFILSTFISPLMEPFSFVVSHVVYYGPIVLLLVLFWGRFCEQASRLGIGFKLFVILNLALSINTQSRFQITAVSAFTIVMVWVVDSLAAPSLFRKWNLGSWVLLSLFYSKVWYRFNTGDMNSDGTMPSLSQFPIQNLFMNIGPWMSHSMYIVQGTIVLVTAVLLYWPPGSLKAGGVTESAG